MPEPEIVPELMGERADLFRVGAAIPVVLLAESHDEVRARDGKRVPARQIAVIAVGPDHVMVDGCALGIEIRLFELAEFFFGKG